MNTILLQPTDVLFFRDGRPMGGASAGHGAVWPLPTVTDAALHAALHRSGIDGHLHRRGQNGIYSNDRDRKYGSLVTAGPFPYRSNTLAPLEDEPQPGWYFPRPLDLTGDTLSPTLLPVRLNGSSSLAGPLKYAVACSVAPSKESAAKNWLSASAYQRYLKGEAGEPGPGEAVDDRDFSDAESTIGIGIDSETQTQDGERIYSAHYLRLHEGWRLGVLAKTDEKLDSDASNRADLIPKLIDSSRHIVVGGQQRICTATIEHTTSRLPLPLGLCNGFQERTGKYLVKWVLLSPAVFPSIGANDERQITPHPGGWLPNWISIGDGAVLLRGGDTDRRSGESREAWRARVRRECPTINARLVAAIVPKPIIVTGWALPHDEANRPEGGAKPTLLAVPAGAVYYFEATANPELGTTAEQEAQKLANALNWHGDPAAPDFGTTIKNRRSTLLGEKGFGLGVCGSWDYFGTRS